MAAPTIRPPAEVLAPAAVAMNGFIAEVRATCENETTISRILARTEAALKALLADPACLDGLAIDREEHRSWKVYTDPEHLFCIHVSRQKPNYRRGVHDHGELGWAVYGVFQGEVVQELYERLDDGSHPDRVDLRALPPIVQHAGDATVIPVGGAHAPHNEDGYDAWTVVIRSRDLTTIWRNFYDIPRARVVRRRSSGD
ncbi:MAG TPA: hypothetical protein VMW62_01925 [Chloroflexota bacterium]|nr:hypothetical protein [Chloroflexota bacterium]